jgi:hypothetical protein
MVVFIKPTDAFCVAISVFMKDEKMYLDDVLIGEEISTFMINVLTHFIEDRKLDDIRFESSVYVQYAKELREKTDGNINIFCYKSKMKPADLISSNADWLKEHLIIRSNCRDQSYGKFIDLITSYSTGDVGENTTAVSILSDAAKYFRRNN